MQILDCYYKYDHKEKHPTVFLVGKDANGKLRTLHTEHHYPYFYAVGELPPKFADNHMIHSIDAVDKFLPIGYQTQTTPMWKITLFNPGDTSEIRDGLIDRGLTVFEADILYKYRYMVDHNLGGMIWTNDGIHRVENELNAPLKTLAFDIEVLLNEAGNFPISSPSVDTKGNLLREADPIVIITMAMSDGNIKLLKNDDEAELLRDFVTEVNKFDPDIIVSYNGDSFDWPYVIDRAHLNEVPLSIGRDKSEPKVREVGDSRQILIRGRVSLDMLPIIRKNYSLKNYKLATAASLVNEEKLDVKPQEMRRLWLAHDAKFLQYAKQDANITLKLLLDLKLLEKYIALAKATGLLLQDVLYSGQSAMIENLFLKEFNKRDRVLGIKPRRSAAKIKSEPLDCVFGSYIETLESDDDGVKYEGATVLTPPKGLVEDVVVLDYKSLYPTIIISHNLSYDTILLDDTLDVPYEEAPKFNQEATRGPRFVDKSVLKGILPSILETLLEERLEAKKAMKAAADGSLEKTLYDAKQYAFKILLNSCYGYCGFKHSRTYVLDIAASVTSYGRQNIEKTRQLVKEMGYETVYGDSIAGDRCVTIKSFDGMINVVPIETMFTGTIRHDVFSGKDYIIEVPYMALTHHGWKPIKSIMRHEVSKPMYRVIQKYGETVCSSDHSLMNRHLIPTKPGDMPKTTMYRCSIPDTLIKIDKIDLYEYVKHFSHSIVHFGKPKLSEFNIIVVDGVEYIKFGWKSNPYLIKRFIYGDDLKCLCRLLGAFISEGHISYPGGNRTGLHAAISSNNRDWLLLLKSDYEQLFINCTGNIFRSGQTETGNDAYGLLLSTKLAGGVFKALCNGSARNKKIPGFIYNLSDEYTKEFMRLLLEGDGTRKHGTRYSAEYMANNFRYTTVSTQLISGVSTLLNISSIPHTIRFNQKNRSYELATSYNIRNKPTTYTKVLLEPYIGYVYDLEVEDAHTFVDSCGSILLTNTDSLFIKTDIPDFDKSMEIADKLAKAATAQLPPPMELVPEAYCKRVLFLAKKHYSKYQFEKKGVGKIKSKGLETVRRDWCEYTSETLTAILNTIMLEGDADKALQIARDAITKIKTADLRDPDIFWKLVLSKKFGSDYKPGAETRLAHLILIDKMKKRNLTDYQVNDRVQFVVVRGASTMMKDDHRGKFREQAEDPEYALEHDIELDRQYYIEKQLVKPIHRMLGVLGVTEAMLLNSNIAKDCSVQKTLFDW